MTGTSPTDSRAPVPGGRTWVPEPRTARVRRRAVRAGWAVVTLLAAAVALAAVYRVFVRTWTGQTVDEAALDGASIGRTTLWEVARPVLEVVSVGFVVAAVIGCVLVAVLRRRWTLALASALVLGGANLTTQLLKEWVFERPEHGIGRPFNTLPSGHTTVAASVAVAALLVVPPRVRPWVGVLGAGYAGATGVSTLIGQWHRPSDVVAGLLVTLAWGALACLVLALSSGAPYDRRPSTGAVPLAGRGQAPGRRGDRTATVLLAVVAVVVGVLAAVLLVRVWGEARTDTSDLPALTAYLGGVAGVMATAAGVFAVLLPLRRAVTGSVGSGAPS